MMSWNRDQLGAFLTLQRGFDITKKEQENGPYLVISSSGPKSSHSRFKVSGPGVIIGRKGTLGSAFYTEDDFWPHDTTLWVKDFKGNHPKFAYFFLKSLQLEQFDSGAANPSLNRNHVHKLIVSYPPLAEQKRIAGILSAYDDLIGNNLRRIKILEEMAQSLYREWFVLFRFPGHESTEFQDSPLGPIPKDWEVKKVEDIVKRYPVGKQYNQKSAISEGSVPILDQGKSGIIGYHNDTPGFVASEDDPVIVFANHTCYQKLIQFPFSAIQNVLPFKPSPELPRNIYWLHWATKDLIQFNDYKGHWPEFIAKDVITPPSCITHDFGLFSETIVKKIYALEKKNDNLRKTRDLLLPKLLTPTA